MDANRFDSLARAVGAGTTRRLLLAAAAALAPARFLEATAWGKTKGDKKKVDNEKKKKKKACPPCKKRKKGKCKGTLPDGAACAGGTCSGGACVPGTGTCSGSAGNVVTGVANGTYAGQSLQATHTLQPFGTAGQTNSQLDFTLGGAPLLTVQTEGAGGVVTVTFTYGDAFSGIRRAQFTNDGSTITGEIDGRAIVPLPAGADPNSATFQDGGPPPDVQVDPNLQAAITAVWQQLDQSAGNCNAAASGVKGASGRHTSKSASRRNRSQAGSRRHQAGNIHAEDHPENDAECLALYIPCETGYVGCMFGTAGCAAFLFGAGICVAVVVVACTYAAGVCRRVVRLGPTCCPVTCGGNLDTANPFGEDPGCCEEGETCFDPHDSRSACCPPGESACGDACCPNGNCMNGFCCRPPQFACGNECCGGFARCCGGHCCTGDCCGNSLCCAGGTCNGGVCCNPGSFPCGAGCCSNVCCNGNCCAPGADCINNQCIQICTVNEFSCTPPSGVQRCCSNALYTDCCSWGCGVNACTR